tara:strand:- start:9794 stop:9976 length:183 start_codon:yes stop_codon:yes gene_type:complete
VSGYTLLHLGDLFLILTVAFLAVRFESRNANDDGAPLSPGDRIFSPLPPFMRLRLAAILA